MASYKNFTARLIDEPSFLAKEHFIAQYEVVHNIPGRVRLRPKAKFVEDTVASIFLLDICPSLTDAFISISEKTGSILIIYGSRQSAIELYNAFIEKSLDFAANNDLTQLVLNSQCESNVVEVVESVRNPIPHKVFSQFMPAAYRTSHALMSSVKYLLSGIKAIFTGKLNLDALDGAAVAVCILTRDFRTLGSIVFFFALGEFLADWTRKKSRANLADSLAIKLDKVWIRRDDIDIQVPFNTIEEGDNIVVYSGSIIPVDGTVVEGDGLVNQASMTGESIPVHRTSGATVYAGTVLEDGTLVIKVTKVGSNTRINAILNTIEESETAKASIQSKYENLSDAIVPYNFALCGIVYALTRNVMKASSVLLVDYSCAIKLATPLSIFTGMRQATEHGVLIKGGKFMEAIATADVVVFDKTGTLTQAKPTVVEVVSFGDKSENEILKLSACLEEHFAHPVGQAVVRAAEERDLHHQEEHTQVDYIVAHGIASTWNDEKILIGSEHFVLEDEHKSLSDADKEKIEERTSKGLSALYFAMGDKVEGAIFIEDTIREDAKQVIKALKADGIKKVVMLTGDSDKTAASIAKQLGIKTYKSRLLPEDKAKYIEKLKKQGHTVVMVGDGINDSPALSAANVGIAMVEGADIAREIADIVLMNGELSGLLVAREISRQSLARIKKSFWQSVGWNTAFLVGGLFGVIRPTMSAMLHNTTTAALSMGSLKPFKLENKEIK